MRGVMVFVLGILLATSVSAATYISDEGFMGSTECSSKGYENIISLKGADGVSYSYCVKKEEFSTSKSFLIDSYIAFGVEECREGYEEKVITFQVYKDLSDYSGGVKRNAKLCLKKQSRTAQTILDVGYQQFSLSACASGISLIESFVDGSGRTVYHCSADSTVSSDSSKCGAYSGSVLSKYPDCNYGVNHMGGKLQSIGTVIDATVLGGTDCPKAFCVCKASSSGGAEWKCFGSGCGAYSGTILPEYPICNYGVNHMGGKLQSIGTVIDATVLGGTDCPEVSCACTADSSKANGTGWDCSNGCGAYSGAVLPKYSNCIYGANHNTGKVQPIGTVIDATVLGGTDCPEVSCACTADSSVGGRVRWKCEQPDCKSMQITVGKLFGARETPDEACKRIYGEEYSCDSKELPVCEGWNLIKRFFNRERCKTPSCQVGYSGVKMRVSCCK